MRLKGAIEAFIAERTTLGYSRPLSLVRPLGLLHQAVARRRGEKAPLTADVTLDDLTEVLDEGVQRGVSSRSVELCGTYLRVFCRFLLARQLVASDPSKDLLLPRPVRRIGYVPTPAEVLRLLRVARPESALQRAGLCAREPPAAMRRQREKRLYLWLRQKALALALRDTALLEVLYGSALRYREACRLDVTDLDLRERTLFIRSGKGRKDRVVPLTEASACALARYLAEGRPVLGDETQTPALFLLESGARLSGFWRDFPLKRLLAAAGLPKKLSPHRLRHACAIHLLDDGADIVAIARLLGHERLDVTALYLALSTASLDRALLAAHPREREVSVKARDGR